MEEPEKEEVPHNQSAISLLPASLAKEMSRLEEEEEESQSKEALQGVQLGSRRRLSMEYPDKSSSFPAFSASLISVCLPWFQLSLRQGGRNATNLFFKRKHDFNLTFTNVL